MNKNTTPAIAGNAKILRFRLRAVEIRAANIRSIGGRPSFTIDRHHFPQQTRT
jgi:hypothetical protein